ncbi:MAG TPA: hypothetical protein VKD22_17745 [Ramlibacter sp.]|nr:hypothetical protein [Ramlibacter sp.]
MSIRAFAFLRDVFDVPGFENGLVDFLSSYLDDVAPAHRDVDTEALQEAVHEVIHRGLAAAERDHGLK